MKNISKAQVMEILGTTNGICFDSRKVKKGNLFIALKGEKADGHAFLNAAKKNGAALFLVNKKAKEIKTFTPKNAMIEADDTLKAFHRIALYVRHRYFTLPVLGITGSVGKTTVKEMCKEILESYGKGLSPEGSFNNHTGVPLTVSQMTGKDKWAIVEMGMNHKGEITPLSKIAKPDVCVITQIAPAHIGNLGNLKNIIQAKLEILKGAKKGAPLIIPDNDRALKAAAKKKTKNILTFGRGKLATCRIVKEEQTKEGKLKIILALKGKEKNIELILNTIGGHNAMNAACAVLATQTLLPKSNPKAVESFKQPPRRLNVRTLKNGTVLIDDAYNANPLSMKSALDTLQPFKGKKIGLVMGDMLEMGMHSTYFHKELGKQIAEINPHLLIAVGKEAKTVIAAADMKNSHAFQTSDDENILEIIEKNGCDVILVKGSNGIALNKITEKLK